MKEYEILFFKNKKIEKEKVKAKDPVEALEKVRYKGIEDVVTVWRK